MNPDPHPRHSSVAATLLAVALFGGIVGFAADRYISTNPNSGPNPALTAAPTPGSAPRIGPRATGEHSPASASATSTDPQVAAIQALILKGDQEQQDAFSTSDPTIMSDTSTADFYQQQVQTNQDLKANGVTAIKLIGIDWGAVSVTGSDATATAWETWSTTYSDGTTEQSRDRNEYTLVQDNGSWKVSADAHPDDPNALADGQSPSAPTRPGQPGQSTQPGQPQPSRPRGQGRTTSDTSENWSGYAATGGTFTSVTGTWTVPAFSPTSTAGSDAAWVGIGGTSSRDLIQAGTQQTVNGSGTTQYQAWVETLPLASHPVALTVEPGDSVTVSITQQSQPDQWLISMKNNTSGQTFEVTETYTSSMSSAEWIEEAPTALRGRQIPLDTFGSIDFSAGSAVKDGQTVSIAGAGGRAITMVDRAGQRLATPSPLAADGASFSVTRN